MSSNDLTVKNLVNEYYIKHDIKSIIGSLTAAVDTEKPKELRTFLCKKLRNMIDRDSNNAQIITTEQITLLFRSLCEPMKSTLTPETCVIVFKYLNAKLPDDELPNPVTEEHFLFLLKDFVIDEYHKI